MTIMTTKTTTAMQALSTFLDKVDHYMVTNRRYYVSRDDMILLEELEETLKCLDEDTEDTDQDFDEDTAFEGDDMEDMDIDQDGEGPLEGTMQAEGTFRRNYGGTS